jgi:hypothetical protein
MPTIAEVRQKYPQYNDMSDEALAGALHQKYYSDMPREQFDAKIGFGATPAQETPVPVGKPTSPVQQMLGGMENLLPAAEQGTNPNPEAYKGSQYLGPATIGEGDEVFYKDANGVPQPTDKSKHVVIRDPRDNQVKVFARSDDTSEGGLVGASRVLAPGLATGPLARTPGAVRGAVEAVTQPGGQASRNEIVQAATKLGEYGTPVEVPKAIASDSFITQQAGAGLRNIPFVGDPIIRNTEKAIEQLGKATGSVAENLGGASVEGAGQLAKDNLLETIGPKSKSIVDDAYNAVDSAIDPTMLHPLDATAGLAAEMKARNIAAGQPGSSKALNLVEQAIAKPEAAPDSPLFKDLFAKLGNREAAQNIAARLGETAAEAAPEGLTYHGIKDLRTRVGQLMDQKILPPEWNGVELKRLYGSLTEDLGNAVERGGNTSAKALWQRANATAAEVAQRRKDLADIVGLKGDASPAQVFNRIKAAAGSNSRADIDLLMKAKHAIGENWDKVASAATMDLGKNTQGVWQPGQFLKDWQKLSPAGKSALYGTSAHGQALENIAKISTRWPQLQKFQNPSGTARGIGAAGILLNPLHALHLALEPTTAIGVGGSFLLARALAKPATAASVSAWSRAYEGLARAPRPSAATVAQFTMQSRNLANNLNSQFGTQVSPSDFLKAVQPKKPEATRQHMMPFRPGEQMDNLMASVNGPQGYPDFRWVNPAGVDAFLANGPMSSNVEDRRGPDYTYNEAQAAQARRRAGRGQ